MKAYIVACLFGAPPTGMLCANATIANNSESAVGGFVDRARRDLGLEAPELAGVFCAELTEEFMRAALNGGGAKAGEVSYLRPVEAASTPSADAPPSATAVLLQQQVVQLGEDQPA